MLDHKFTLIDEDTARVRILIKPDTTMADLAEFYDVGDISGYMGECTLIFDKNHQPSEISCIVKKAQVEKICDAIKTERTAKLDEDVGSMLDALATFGIISAVNDPTLPEGVKMYVFNDVDEKKEKGH